MADHIKREMRYFRNHYLCDDCTRSGSEWSDEMAVVGPSFCPNCDRRCEPYASEPLMEQIKLDPADAVEILVEMMQDAGLLEAEGQGPSIYLREEVRRMKRERV